MSDFTIKGGLKFDEFMKKLEKSAGLGLVLNVGFLEGAAYPDGTSVASVAAENEFGNPSKRIPSRPFFRNAIHRNSKDWPGILGAVIDMTNYNEKNALIALGEVIRGQVKLEIRDMKTPRNAAMTVKLKGFDDPLIHTKHMLNSVNYEVSGD
jgi:hypothetical protein